MNKYKNVLIGEAASSWKKLIGRFHWLDDNEIALHLIEVHEQYCQGICPLERNYYGAMDQYEGQLTSSRAGETDVTNHKADQANLSLDLEVDDGAESVDEDSSGESDHSMVSDEEADVKLEPESMDYISQNPGSTYLREDSFLHLSANKSTDPGGDNLCKTLNTVGCNTGNTVIQSTAQRVCDRQREVKMELGSYREDQSPSRPSGKQDPRGTGSLVINWPLFNTEKSHQRMLNSVQTGHGHLSTSGPELKTPLATNSMKPSQVMYNAQGMSGIPVVSKQTAPFSQSVGTTQDISFLKAMPSNNYLTTQTLTPNAGSAGHVGSQTLRTVPPSVNQTWSSLPFTTGSVGSQTLRTVPPSVNMPQSSLPLTTGGVGSQTLRTVPPSVSLNQSSLPLTLTLQRATGGMFMIRPPLHNNKEPSIGARQPHVLNTNTTSDRSVSQPAIYLPQMNLVFTSGGNTIPQQSSSENAGDGTPQTTNSETAGGGAETPQALNSEGQPLVYTSTEPTIPKETVLKEELQQHERDLANSRESQRRSFPSNEGCHQEDLSTEIEDEISKLARKETLDSNKFQSKLTHKKTAGDIRLLYVYLHSVGEHRKIHQIPLSELDSYFHKYFKCVRKANGDEYEPFSLRSMAASFDRYLDSYNYGYNIFRNKEFAGTKEVLQNRMKQLFHKGKGNFDQRSNTLTDTDVDKLFESGQLGSKDPECLLRTMWFFNTVYLGVRSSKEHHQLRWGDINLCSEEKENLEFLEYRNRKSEHVRVAGGNPSDLSRCPVALYKIYRDSRPPGYSEPSDPFYLVCGGAHQKWFRTQSVGVNKLNKFLSVMAKNAGLYRDGSAFVVATGITIVVANAAASFGYVISAAAPTVTVALSIAPAIMIPFLLFGGFFLNSGSIPDYLIWMKYLSWFSYGNEMMVINQWEDVTQISCSSNTSCFSRGDLVITSLSFDEDNFYLDLGLLFVLTAVFRLLAFIILCIRAKRSSA